MKSLYIIVVLAIFTAACSSSLGTSVGNPPTNSGKAASAVAALFSESTSSSINAQIKKAIQNQTSDCEGTPASCMCSEVASGQGGPDQVSSSTYNTPGTYGSENYSVTLTEEDFCELPDGNQNDTAGVDGEGRFAGFELTADIDASCTDTNNTVSILTMKTGSSGVWRNTDETDTSPAFEPQIYAFFTFETEGATFELNCALFLDTNGLAIFSDCSDESGNTITQDSDVSCQFPD